MTDLFSRLLSEIEFFIHHHRWREKIATDTLDHSQAQVLYKISGPMGGGFLYTTGAVLFRFRILNTQTAGEGGGNGGANKS